MSRCNTPSDILRLGKYINTKIIPECLVAVNAFIVVQKVAASEKDQFAIVNLNSLWVMRGVTPDDVDAGLVDQSMRKGALIAGNVIPPIPAPVERRHKDVSWPLQSAYLCSNFGDRPRGQIGQKIDTGTFLRGGPCGGNATRRRAQSDNNDPSAQDRQYGRTARFIKVVTGTGRRHPDVFQRSQRLQQTFFPQSNT